MSVEAMLAVQQLRVRITHACFRVLMTLAEHADKSGRNSWASIETIATEAQTDGKTVRRCLATLEQHELIAGERGRGRGNTTVWSLTFPILALGKEGLVPGFNDEKEGLTPGISDTKGGMTPSIPGVKEGVMPGIEGEKEGVAPGIPELKEGLSPIKEGMTPVKEGLSPPEPVLNLSRTISMSSPPAPTEKELMAEMVTIWNETCGDVLPKAQTKIPTSRQAHLRGRLADEMGGSIDAWRRFCERVRAAPHLVGRNNQGWRASLDWCLKPANTAKVLEGNYDPVVAVSGRPRGRSYAGCL